MKTIKNYSAFTMIALAFSLFSYQSNAQFVAVPGTGGAGLQTTSPPNQVVSVGTVPGGGPPALNLIRAKLHVNSFFMPASTATIPILTSE